MLIWGEKAVENCKQRDDTTNYKNFKIYFKSLTWNFLTKEKL